MKQGMRAFAIALLCAGLAACGASASTHASTVKKPAPKAQAPAPQPAVAVAEAPPAPPAAGPLPANYDAGEISRDKLLSVLNAGPGRFLQRVRVKGAKDDRGRFAGWRIVELFPGEDAVTTAIVPGDIVVRVNGQSVERPEQFKTVWDSLALSSELVVTVRRGDQQGDVRYRIVTEQLPP